MVKIFVLTKFLIVNLIVLKALRCCFFKILLSCIDRIAMTPLSWVIPCKWYSAKCLQAKAFKFSCRINKSSRRSAVSNTVQLEIVESSNRRAPTFLRLGTVRIVGAS